MKVECSYLGLYVQIEFGIVPFDSDLGGRTVGCRNKVQSLFVATDGNIVIVIAPTISNAP